MDNKPSVSCLFAGLEPGELYQYQCGDPSIPVMSDIFYFRTMPVSSPTNYPRTIAVVGDLGLTYNTSTTFSHLLSNHPDLLVLVGGVSYADIYLTDGTSSDCYSCSFPQTPMHESYQPRWDYWGRSSSSILQFQTCLASSHPIQCSKFTLINNFYYDSHTASLIKQEKVES